MTDTSAPSAPPPSAALTPQTPANLSEVVIDTSQVPSPTPIGSQAPEKPTESRAPTRREAIQAAFDRATKAQDAKEKPKAAKPAPVADARPGHNQPPEATPDEKLDLKRRPGDQPRGERGQFAPRETVQGNAGQSSLPGETAKGMGEPKEKSSAPTLPPHAPYAEPPPRMAEAAKADWAATPERVRGDIYRMHQEFQGAYQQYRGDHEAMNEIRPFHEMARQHGTTLTRALSNYVNMEQKLRQDVIGGLDVIVNNLNLRSQDGQKLGLKDIAYHVLNQSPESHQLVQQQNAQQAAQHQIGALHQEIEGLKNHLYQMHTAAQFNQIRGGIDQFATTHPRVDELSDLIKTEIDLGFDLDTAYKRAELLRPATHAAQTGTTSAQTRPTDKSIYGAPDAGPSNGTSKRRSEKPVGRREAIENAIRRVNGAL